MSSIIRKGNLYFRDVRMDDKEVIHKWRNSPVVSTYMYSNHHITEEEHDRWFQNAFGNTGVKYWIIMCDREAVGFVNLYDIDEKNKRSFFGMYISTENMRGKGVGSFAVYQLMKYVFEDMQYNKLCCDTLISNSRAIDFYKKFSFREEGIYHQHVMKDGKYADVVALAILKSEWDEKKAGIEKKLNMKGVI